jgi:phytoene dehydrogenase-like protein
MARLFSPLRGEPLDKYDAVVIGAGIGGLICANLLARDGLAVLLVEQHYVVGGYTQCFRRKGFNFDAATHFYPLLGNPTTITGKLLLDLGVNVPWVKMDPVDQFHFPDGTSFSVPADFDRYLSKLKEEFPHEAPAIDAFFRVVREVYMLGLLEYFRSQHSERIEPYLGLTLRDAIDQYFTDRKLKLLLTADCPHWGSPPSRTSFVFDSTLRLSYFLGNYYPGNGSQFFADSLARRFQEFGGDILLCSRVQRIIVDKNTVRGVEVEFGSRRAPTTKEIRSDVVVSNADLRLTVESLVGENHFPREYIESYRSLRPTFPCFLTHLGVRDVSTEFLRRVNGYYWDEWDSDNAGTSALKFKLFVPTLFEPAMAPPGCHVLIIQKVMDIDFDRVTDWAAHKARTEDFVMKNLEKIIPGLSEKILIRTSASALTSHRFTLNYQGSMLGWEMSPEQLGDKRPGVRSPVNNLYFVGHWVEPGGGITPVLVSAIKAAKMITRHFSLDPAACSAVPGD